VVVIVVAKEHDERRQRPRFTHPITTRFLSASVSVAPWAGSCLVDPASCIYTGLMILWDESKRRRNLAKHGLDFVGAEAIFDDFMLVAEDTREPYGEPRDVALGLKAGRVVALVYADRGDHVRLISLRKATSNETARYLQARGQ
jgi:uncharacterized DUF497 family protein